MDARRDGHAVVAADRLFPLTGSSSGMVPISRFTVGGGFWASAT